MISLHQGVAPLGDSCRSHSTYEKAAARRRMVSTRRLHKTWATTVPRQGASESSAISGCLLEDMKGALGLVKRLVHTTLLCIHHPTVFTWVPKNSPVEKSLSPSLQHCSKPLFPYRKHRLLSVPPATATAKGMLQHSVPRTHPFPAHTDAGGAESPAILGSPGLPREVDGECRLWEEMTMFIVWIKYFSWPSLCCSVSFISLFFLPPPQHPKHADFPSLFPEALQHARRKSALKNTGRDREGTELATAQKFFFLGCLTALGHFKQQASATWLTSPREREL